MEKTISDAETKMQESLEKHADAVLEYLCAGAGVEEAFNALVHNDAKRKHLEPLLWRLHHCGKEEVEHLQSNLKALVSHQLKVMAHEFAIFHHKEAISRLESMFPKPVGIYDDE